ncbi:MAG: hypothetical protein R2825_09140 [Saprospiraceae bacterium]
MFSTISKPGFLACTCSRMHFWLDAGNQTVYRQLSMAASEIPCAVRPGTG